MPGGDLQRGISAAVIDHVEERRGRGEQVVEDASRRIVGGLDIGHAAVVLDGEVGNVAGGTADPVEDGASPFGGWRVLVEPRLEVVGKVKPKVAHRGRMHSLAV